MKQVLAYLGGVQGSGKGSISNLTGENHNQIKVFHVSMLLRDYLGVKSLDNFDTLSSIECNLIRGKFYREDLFDLKGSFGLIDSHYIKVLANGEICACINRDSARPFGLFLHLVSDPNLILDRINTLEGIERDRRRERYAAFNNDLVSSIRRLQELSISFGQNLADELQRPFIKIENYGSLLSASEKVYEAIYSNLIRV